MKNVLFTLLILGCIVLPATPSYGGEASVGMFYSSLEPYGEWISISGDVYAWHPLQVAADWRPYDYGRWVWTDGGWYWASDEPWAWAVYHYGRWYYDDYYGWVWIPGYDWAPAWVEWRYGGDCVGWAPLGPYAVFSANFGIFYRTSWVTPYRYWCFTDWRYMTNPGLHQYVYRAQDNTRFIGRTRAGGSVQYDGGRIISRGPEPQVVERRGNVRIDRVLIMDGTTRQPERWVRSGDRGRLEVYRPSFQPPTGAEAVRPSRLRGVDRPVQLDVRNLDVRAREQDRMQGKGLPGQNVGRVRERQVNPEAWPERRPGGRVAVSPRRRDVQQRVQTNQDVSRPRVRENARHREFFSRPGAGRQERAGQPRVAPRNDGKRRDR